MYDDADWPLYLNETRAMSEYSWVHNSIIDQIMFIGRHNDRPSQIVLGGKARLDLMRWMSVMEVLSSDGPVILRDSYFGVEVVAPEDVDPWTVLVRV